MPRTRISGAVHAGGWRRMGGGPWGRDSGGVRGVGFISTSHRAKLDALRVNASIGDDRLNKATRPLYCLADNSHAHRIDTTRRSAERN